MEGIGSVSKANGLNIDQEEGKRLGKILKFIISGAIGLFIFLAPVFDGTVPILQLVNVVKGFFGDNLTVIAKVVATFMFVSLIFGKVFHVKFFEKLFEGDSKIKIGVYCVSVLFVAAVSFGFAPSFMLDERIGLKALTIGSTVFLTIAITGWAVILILNSGVVEFFGVLVETVMRPLFKLPGFASVDAISSFVSSPSIGVYITDRNYMNKLYTQREAFAVATGFSVMSIGYMGVLCSMVGIEKYYGTILVASLILVVILGAITVRIPPISRIPDVYVDGTVQTEEQKKVTKYDNRFGEAVNAAVKRVDSLTVKSGGEALINALKFAFKIVGFAIPIVIIALSTVYYTPVFKIIGTPVAPILQFLGMPGAKEIAPSTLIGLIEITLPTVTASAYSLPDQSYFFVILLSAVQIIFLTECVNAILASHFKATLPKLLLMFVIRTVIAIPLVALVTHIVFGF